jgi:hypothetical protein
MFKRQELELGCDNSKPVPSGKMVLAQPITRFTHVYIKGTVVFTVLRRFERCQQIIDRKLRSSEDHPYTNLRTVEKDTKKKHRRTNRRALARISAAIQRHLKG